MYQPLDTSEVMGGRDTPTTGTVGNERGREAIKGKIDSRAHSNSQSQDNFFYHAYFTNPTLY